MLCKKNHFKSIPFILSLLFTMNLFGQFQLCPIFSDHMVLQRNQPINIWGWGDNGKTIKVIFQEKEYQTEIQNGEWKVTLPQMAAGGPYKISISDEIKTIELNDILIGDVWLCSGQSNMEWTVKDANNPMFEITNSADNNIRHFMVNKTYSQKKEVDLDGGPWEVAGPDKTGNFTAVGFYFARELRKHVDVPIGLLHSSWGGSRIETWMSGETLGMVDSEKEIKEELDRAHREYLKRVEHINSLFPGISKEERGIKNGEAIWAKKELDESTWIELEAPNIWEASGFDGFDGIAWYRKTIELSEEESNKNAVISLAKIDDSDETYINGKKVGGMVQAWSTERVYQVPADILKKGKNIIAIRVEDTGGGGGIHGEGASLFFKTAERSIDLSGKWKFKFDAFFESDYISSPHHIPTLVYNKMIHPILDFPINGALWYQGESNAGSVEDATEYEKLFKDMINSWRELWKVGDFPFLYVQLANFMEADDKPSESNWALLRESQTKTLELENTGQAVIIDIGEADDIHPRNKQDVGLRLSMAARKIAYGENGNLLSPTYSSHDILGNQVRVNFENCGEGLMTKSKYGYINGFAVAGDDKVFHWAKGTISNENSVVISSGEVEHPKYIRYGWGDNPDDLNLYNKEGLPACPFRTDK